MTYALKISDIFHFIENICRYMKISDISILGYSNIRTTIMNVAYNGESYNIKSKFFTQPRQSGHTDCRFENMRISEIRNEEQNCALIFIDFPLCLQKIKTCIHSNLWIHAKFMNQSWQFYCNKSNGQFLSTPRFQQTMLFRIYEYGKYSHINDEHRFRSEIIQIRHYRKMFDQWIFWELVKIEDEYRS